ncbi:hypothetical protein C8J44_3206 [Sphingomonas sp. PP-CE-3A-406]|uniref:hypothetical protein n=1 Tax=unclassified Sphingomonas TaxID=196159 RepID=UPI000EF90E0E|nr:MULTISPECIES: hypothetical protein [unclassified Sphingomonas]RMB34293.1 hypothetical protein C8J47_2014 [Sphingomonas sp. PP-F2F-G114-C0414]RMB52177.1 hypothetical protein C8J44_3206 [Sphingomonas sp. PP-CE-3A-406]
MVQGDCELILVDASTPEDGRHGIADPVMLSRNGLRDLEVPSVPNRLGRSVMTSDVQMTIAAIIMVIRRMDRCYVHHADGF